MKESCTPALSSELVEQIIAVIRFSGLRSVHYTGAADEGLLRALLLVEPKLKLSVMDMPDQWNTGAACWWDERDSGNIPCPECPAWLEDITFYQEGAADHEIAIGDWPWDSADQLRRIVRFTSYKPPVMLILFQDALTYEEDVNAWIPEKCHWGPETIKHRFKFQHSFYDWEQIEDLWIGRWKSEKISYYERRQRYKQQTNNTL